MLTVSNQRGEDVTIYIMQAGLRGRRLGEVTSYGTATFALTPYDAPTAANVQFLARAKVTGTLEVSDAIPAASGASYEWKLPPSHDYSFLTLRFFR